MTYAPPASRSYDSARITLGMITIPVTVYVETVDTSKASFSRKLFTKDGGHAVGVKKYDKETDKDLAEDEIVKKVETSSGPVYVSDTEIESLMTLTPHAITVKGFYPLATAGKVFVPKQYRSVEPAKILKGKKKVDDPLAQTFFAVLLEAMRTENVLAYCEYVSRGKPVPVVLLPDGMLWVVHFEEELRERREVTLPAADAALVEQTRALIQAKLGGDHVELSDVRSQLIQEFAEQKAAAGDFDESVEVEPETPEATTAQDLMALLQASIASAAA